MGEGVTVDAAGNVYAGEVGPVQGLTKFIPRLTQADAGADTAAAATGGWAMPLAAGMLIMGALWILTMMLGSGSRGWQSA